MRSIVLRQRGAFVFSLFLKGIQDRYQVEDFQLSLHLLMILRFSGPRGVTGTVYQVCSNCQSAGHHGDPQDSVDGEICKLSGIRCSVGPWNRNSWGVLFGTKAFQIEKDVINFLGLIHTPLRSKIWHNVTESSLVSVMC
jgi:hypothetical protein